MYIEPNHRKFATILGNFGQDVVHGYLQKSMDGQGYKISFNKTDALAHQHIIDITQRILSRIEARSQGCADILSDLKNGVKHLKQILETKTKEQTSTIFGLFKATIFELFSLVFYGKRIRKSYIIEYENLKNKIEFLEQNNREIVLERVQNNGNALKNVGQVFKNDPEVVLAGVRQHGSALMHASKELQNNKQFILQAIRENESTFIFVRHSFQKDPNFVLDAIGENPEILKYAVEFSKTNKLFFEQLQLCARLLKTSKFFLSNMLKRNVRVLKYTSDEFKNNKSVIAEAVGHDVAALSYASIYLNLNRSFILQLVRQQLTVLNHISESLRNDDDFWLQVIIENPRGFIFAPEGLKMNRPFVLKAVEMNPLVLNFTLQVFRADPEVIQAAIYGSIPDNLCKIGDSRYFPKVLNDSLKQLILPEFSEATSINHLEESLGEFIEGLQEQHLAVIQDELGFRGSLEQSKSRLRNYHENLFLRVKNRLGYLGTPPAGTPELERFYQHIEKYLLHLDVFFSKKENQMPNALIERLQILQTQSACGARFQAEAEQLFSMNCIPTDLMTLDKQMALIASAEAKKVLNS